MSGNDSEEECSTLEDSVTGVGIGLIGVGICVSKLLEISVVTELAGMVEDTDWVDVEIIRLNVTGIGTEVLSAFDEPGKESEDE